MTEETTELREQADNDVCRDGSSRAKRVAAHTRHGHKAGKASSPTYHSWRAMLARCRYPERDKNDKHIGRGIVTCERWNSFDLFLADMGERPVGTTLDRFPNNDGNYEPGNCRWATHREQARNTRRSKLTLISATAVALAMLRGGKAREVAARYGISESLPREIIKGRTWPDALANAKEMIGG